MKSSMRYTLASIAMGSVVLLGASEASAYDHMNAAYDLIYNASVNDTNTTGGCSANWGTWEFHTKGACFFTAVLKHGFGYTDTDVFHLWDVMSSSPTSAEYYGIIAGSPHVNDPDPAPADETYFRRITSVTSLQSGDVMLIGAVPGYSGHMMVIRGPAVQMSPQLSPIYNGTIQWAIPIIDSTSTAHGCSGTYKDSRWVNGGCPGAVPEGNMDDGAGFAWIRVYTNIIGGAIIGYSWSATQGSPYYTNNPNATAPAVHRPILFSRLKNLPPPIDPTPPDPPGGG